MGKVVVVDWWWDGKVYPFRNAKRRVRKIKVEIGNKNK